MAGPAEFRKELSALQRTMVSESEKNISDALSALEAKQRAALDKYNAASIQLARKHGVEALRQFALGTKMATVRILKWSV